jgi:arsenical pump membrane protein
MRVVASQKTVMTTSPAALMLTAVLIFLFTLVLVIWQPRGLGIGWSAMVGAVLALALGVVQLSDIPVVWHIVWNATATFVAVIIISLLLDEAGFFEWAALHFARWGRGSGAKLFAFIVLLGAAVAALFANDGAALILTPIVMAMLVALGFSPAATLAFVMAAGFIADAASLPLVVSNLVNIVSADFFKIGFSDYAAVMLPVNLASVATSLVVLYLYFRRDLPAVYNLDQLKAPTAAIRDINTFRAGWVVLALLLVGFFGLEPLGVPVSAVAAVGAAVLLAVAARGHVIGTRKVLREAPWQIVVFSLGMYLVVYGLRNAGLTGIVAGLLDQFAEGGIWGAAMGTGFLTALLSSVMNNMPTVLVGALSIDQSAATGVVREAMVYANVIGCDLGPKITPIGSLATLLWLHVLARKGTTIAWGYYFRVGIVLTLPVLAVTLAALALRLSFT